MCIRDSVHLLIDSYKFFTVKFLFTSTKSGGLLISVLNYLQLSFFLILIFQPLWLSRLFILFAILSVASNSFLNEGD